MRTGSKIGLIAVTFFTICLASCKPDKPNYPITPDISYKSIVRNSDGSAVLKFTFKDGDADIGNPVDQGNNFFFTLYKKNGANWDSVLTTGYVVLPMDGDGKYHPYEGEILVTMFAPFVVPPVSKFKCWIFDRAGHKSNEAYTEEIIP
jgi:hypothetical protein